MLDTFQLVQLLFQQQTIHPTGEHAHQWPQYGHSFFTVSLGEQQVITLFHDEAVRQYGPAN
jgi:hypothetical protein